MVETYFPAVLNLSWLRCESAGCSKPGGRRLFLTGVLTVVDPIPRGTVATTLLGVEYSSVQ